MNGKLFSQFTGNPVLTPGPNGSWDDGDVYDVEVVHDGTLYRMWYSGTKSGAIKAQIGYATSTNGINWVKHGNNPVLQFATEGSWDDAIVHSPAVIFDGSIWKMWYTANNARTPTGIGYATSHDGVNWTRYKRNPILSDSTSLGVHSPCVMLKGGRYHMWYGWNQGMINRIYYATSKDGISWTQINTPVLDIGSSGTWDSVSITSPSVIFLDGKYHMWYQGVGLSQFNGFGHAVSSDGISWIKDPSNPILKPTGRWGALGIFFPSVLYHDRLLKMWFHGKSISGNHLEIGYAECACK